MKRTTVKIPDELDARLRHEAKRRGMTISEVTREALEAHLDGADGAVRRPFLVAAIGSSRGGPADLAARAEEYLAEIIPAEEARSRRS
jgi:Arc/MetJ-type ribon-helix-helix transcriptional regulator